MSNEPVVVCDLCTVNMWQGVFYRTTPFHPFQSSFVLCGLCKAAAMYAKEEAIERPEEKPHG